MAHLVGKGYKLDHPGYGYRSAASAVGGQLSQGATGLKKFGDTLATNLKDKDVQKSIAQGFGIVAKQAAPVSTAGVIGRAAKQYFKK